MRWPRSSEDMTAIMPQTAASLPRPRRGLGRDRVRGRMHRPVVEAPVDARAPPLDVRPVDVDGDRRLRADGGDGVDVRLGRRHDHLDVPWERLDRADLLEVPLRAGLHRAIARLALATLVHADDAPGHVVVD